MTEEKIDKMQNDEECVTEVYECVKPMEIKVTDFISNVSDMVDGVDKTAVLDWIAFAGFMTETVDSQNTTLEKELLEVYLPLCYVKNNFNHEVLQQTLKAQTIGNEIIHEAILFSAGCNRDEVKQLANEGVLMEGYIPLDVSEKGSLSIVTFVGKNDCLFIVQQGDADVIRHYIKLGAWVAKTKEQSLDQVLSNAKTVGLCIQKITHPKLIAAVKNACTATSAFSNITVYDSEKELIIQRETNDLTTEQLDALLHGCINVSDSSEEDQQIPGIQM